MEIWGKLNVGKEAYDLSNTKKQVRCPCRKQEGSFCTHPEAKRAALVLGLNAFPLYQERPKKSEEQFSWRELSGRWKQQTRSVQLWAASALILSCHQAGLIINTLYDTSAHVRRHLVLDTTWPEGLWERSKKQDGVGLIDFCRRTEGEMLDDMAMLLPALVVFGFHLESLKCILTT